MNSRTNVNVPGSIGVHADAMYPLLPGESPDEYKSGLQSTIQELQAQTPMQVYLVEKIFDCLWWIRRYETQKQAVLLSAMVRILQVEGQEDEENELTWDRMKLLGVLQRSDWQDADLQELMENRRLTAHTLTSQALLNRREVIDSIDVNIAMRVKTMAGLQASYEHLRNRRIHIERLQLQNDLLKRDLAALDVPTIGIDDGSRGAQDLL